MTPVPPMLYSLRDFGVGRWPRSIWLLFSGDVADGCEGDAGIFLADDSGGWLSNAKKCRLFVAHARWQASSDANCSGVIVRHRSSSRERASAGGAVAREAGVDTDP